MKRAPLVLGLALTTGAGLGLGLGPYLVGWGLVVAALLASVTFAVGLSRDPGDANLHAALLAVGGLVLAFLAVNVPFTWDSLVHLDARFAASLLEPLGVESPEEARALLLPRWVAVGVVGVAAWVAAWVWRRPRPRTRA
ncbi:MAG: hypothetical protein H6721_10895 [Sandaracinus sp.]|nr:hypothetical protein [Myxococcales bacterium]MCB9618696.1 hypothetical protein [Sandaracinus sp.]MCB9632627.1 hypothetical protein [Sandaracinus sp.]